MAFLPIAPNWSAEVRTSYEFLTEIFTSTNGTEDRVAKRRSARRRLEFTSLLQLDRYRELDAILRQPSAAWHTVADFGQPDAPALAATAVEGDFAVEIVGGAPAWLVSGVQVAVACGYDVERRTVSSVVGSTVNLLAPLTAVYPAGARVYPIVEVSIGESAVAGAITSDLATISWNLLVRPGGAAPDLGEAAQTYDDREVWLARPNWMTSPQITFAQPQEHIDYGYGVIGRYSRVDVADRLTQLTHLATSRAEVGAMVDFFGRCRGRRGEFYSPTWMHDLTLAEPIEDGETNLRVTTEAIGSRFPGGRVYRDILLDTYTAGLLLRRVVMMESAGSVITVDSPLPALAPGDVAMICWLPLCRHAVDTLTVEWRTDTTATITMTPQAIEWRAAE